MCSTKSAVSAREQLCVEWSWSVGRSVGFRRRGGVGSRFVAPSLSTDGRPDGRPDERSASLCSVRPSARRLAAWLLCSLALSLSLSLSLSGRPNDPPTDHRKRKMGGRKRCC